MQPKEIDTSLLAKRFEHDALCESVFVAPIENKKRLAQVLNDLLEPMRQRRAKYDANPALVEEILRTGTARACEEGAKTIADVREAMRLDYF